jgi:hypothetical protein
MVSPRKVIAALTVGLLAIQTAPSAHAQGRIRPAINPFLTRGWHWDLYAPLGDWGYGDAYAADYSAKDTSTKHKNRKYYRIEEPTVSPEQERERVHQIELAWSQSGLSESETQTATALNILLEDLRDLQSKGIQAPDMALETDSLSSINVLARRSNGNPGVLKNDGRLDWPMILQGPEFQAERELINRLAPRAIEQAKDGHVTDLARFTGAVEQLRQNLHAKIGDIASPAYIRASRFLTRIDDAIKILRQPDAGNYFNRTYAARGNTVGELVRYMTLWDLHFAPAMEGDAPAYHALHRALAAYDRAAHEQATGRNQLVRTGNLK